MLDAAQVLAFAAAVLVLVLVPGPNTLLILTHSVAGGRKAGLITALGVETATLLHTLAAALGLSALLVSSPTAYAIVESLGIAYLLFLGFKELREPDRPAATEPRAALPLDRAYWRAVLNNLTNPKVALFFLAFLPQFVRPERGQVSLQLVALGLIVSAIGLGFGALLAVTAGSASRWLRHPRFAQWQHRLTGAVFLALGARLALAR